jgi:hypothetical protein
MGLRGKTNRMETVCIIRKVPDFATQVLSGVWAMIFASSDKGG